MLTPADIAEALSDPIEQMAEFVQRSIEDLPPEVSTDILTRGICMTGGGALLDGLAEELERRVGVKCIVANDPLLCVIKGSSMVLDDLSKREHLLIKP